MTERIALLTFDDAPSPRVARLLDLLDNNGLKSVFFANGSLIQENPKGAEAILLRGHVLGNHGWSHKAFAGLSLTECLREIETTEKAIEAVHKHTGIARQAKLFRFPYGDKGCGSPPLRALLHGLHPKVRAIQHYLKEMGFCSAQQYCLDQFGENLARLHFPFQHWNSCQDWFWTVDMREWAFEGQCTFDFEEWCKVRMTRSTSRTGVEIILMHDCPERYELVAKSVEAIAKVYSPMCTYAMQS